MVELTGSLSGIGLLAVVELIGEVHHSGNLELRKASTSGTLAFDDGRLVAAECGEHHGLQALADCVTELSEGDFTFIEGIPSLERTLDVGPSDLKRLVDRISSGEFHLLANGAGSHEESAILAETTCPLLGFADDTAHHYSRPTALHRCYSAGAPSLVSALEQRDLCLSGRFAACPRYRNTERSQPATTSARESPPTPPNLRVVAQHPEPVSVPSPAPLVAPAPEIPAGVAERLAAGQQMHLSSEPPAASAREVENDVEAVPYRPGRGAMLILGGAVLGFLLVGLIMLVILPALRPTATPPSAAPESASPATPAIAGVVVTPPAIATAANVSPPAIATSANGSAPAVGTAANGSAPAVGTAANGSSPAVFVTPQPVATAANVSRSSATTGANVSPAVAGTAPSDARASSSTGPSVAPTPSPGARASAPTLQPQPTAAGETLMDIRFAAGPADNWVNDPPYAAWSDGAYRFQAHDATHFVAVGVPINQVMSDVIVQATFRKTGGPPGGGYGLIVRDQGPEPRDGKNQQMTAYVLETGDLGEYGVWRRDGDHWVDLVPWMRSTSVRSGGSPNDLAVRAIGNQLIFSVNGTDVTTAEDDALAAGGVGLFVGGDNNEVALDHFSVQLPN